MSRDHAIVVLSLQRLGDVLTAARVTSALGREGARVEVVHWDAADQAAALLPEVAERHALPYTTLRARARHDPIGAFAQLRRSVHDLAARGFARAVNLTSTRPACLLAPLLAPNGTVSGPFVDDGGEYRAPHPALDYLNTRGVDPELNVFAHHDLYAISAGVPLTGFAGLGKTSEPHERDVDAILAVHVHGSSHDKSWRDSADDWADTLVELRRRFAVRIVLLGAPSEAEALTPLAATTGAELFLRPLDETAALLRRCRGLISVDTVAIHLAAAVECPTLVLRQGPARGHAFLPGPQALLVDDARGSTTPRDIVELVARHMFDDTTDPKVAADLGRRLRLQRVVRDTNGYLGTCRPEWLPRDLQADERDRAQRTERDAWHRRFVEARDAPC